MGTFEVGQVVVDGGLQYGVIGVDVAMGEVVTHPGDLGPRDIGVRCRAGPLVVT
jgi:hypothetical protein